jgi:hypothetical protein
VYSASDATWLGVAVHGTAPQAVCICSAYRTRVLTPSVTGLATEACALLFQHNQAQG